MLSEDSHKLVQILQSDLGAARGDQVFSLREEEVCMVGRSVVTGVSLWKEIVNRCEQTLGTGLTPSARREQSVHSLDFTSSLLEI